MIRRYAAVLHLALGLADAGSAIFLFVAISMIRFGPGWRTSWAEAGLDGTTAALLYGAGWWFVLWSRGLYRMRARWQAWREVVDIVQAMAGLAVVGLAVLFLFHLPDVSRLFLFGLFPAQVVTTAAVRLAIRLAFSRLRNQGRNLRYVLMVGVNEAGFAFARRVAAHPELGLSVIGYLAAPGESPAGKPTAPVLGTVDEIERVLHGHVVDEVAICLPPSAWELVDPIAQLCHDEGRIVRIPLLDLGFSMAVGRVEDFEGVPILSVVRGPDRTLELAAKAALDIVGASLALVILSPLLAVIAVTILARDGRPILFRQTRIGLHGRPFQVLKFRTMVVDAEDRRDALAHRNELSGPVFKVTNDPRITRTGRWLRRSSLDELPQLVNVLRGEMSIVGPRPPLASEVDGYDVWHRRRLSMRPGITGLWQVSARHEQEFDRWVELDLDYIERWSMWLDLSIIMRTLPAMLQGR